MILSHLHYDEPFTEVIVVLSVWNILFFKIAVSRLWRLLAFSHMWKMHGSRVSMSCRGLDLSKWMHMLFTCANYCWKCLEKYDCYLGCWNDPSIVQVRECSDFVHVAFQKPDAWVKNLCTEGHLLHSYPFSLILIYFFSIWKSHMCCFNVLIIQRR